MDFDDIRRPHMSERQQLLRQALAEKSPKIANLYESALRVLADGSIPNRHLLAAHSVREMMGGLPKVLDLPALAEQGKLGNKVNALEPVWTKSLNSQCRRGDDDWRGEIDPPLAKLLVKVDELFRWWKEHHPKRRDVARTFFRSTDPSGLHLSETLETKRDERWLELLGYFSKAAHGKPTTEDDFRSCLDQLEAILLDSLYRRPSEDFSAIDAILAESAGTPSPETVDRAFAEIHKGYAQYSYFFDRLIAPGWLKPMAGRNLFKHPPAPTRDGQYIQVPFWPESQCLLRMSKIPAAQQSVLNITEGIPDTDNGRVHDDVVEIALSLPPESAMRLVPWIRGSISKRSPFFIGDKVGDLIVHLADGGKHRVARQLAGTALALQAPKDPARADPQGYFDKWDYKQIIDRALPALVKGSTVEAVKLFSKLLDKAIRLPRREDAVGQDAYLSSRHPAVERDPDRSYDIPVLLLCATRDAARLLVDADSAMFPVVIKLFQQYDWISFRRLELHLACVFPEKGQERAERVFQDPAILERRGIRREAALLLKKVFPLLTAKTQQCVLCWIDVGPSTESIRSRLETLGYEVTDDNIRNRADRWRLDHFSILEGQLPQPYRSTYADLNARLGPPNPPDLVPSIEVFREVEQQAPRSADELAGMPVREVLDFLRSWVPDAGPLGPSVFGLGDAFGEAVCRRPADFAAAAEQMQGLDPDYIRSLFRGLAEASKQNGNWDWEPVLKLARWVAVRDQAIPGGKAGRLDQDLDRRWHWTRNSLINLLSAGFKTDENTIPIEHRTMVWEALQPLTNDPDPGLELEREESFDPYNVSINSTRGLALRAVVGYAFWVRRHAGAERKAEGPPPDSFDLMPEVRGVLDEHLDVEHEPTLTVRSVYGIRFPELATLDWDWVSSNVHRIFPVGNSDEPRFRAAWESFISYREPYRGYVDLLMPCYQRAVALIGRPGGMARKAFSPDNRLAEHLMAYYGNGYLDFGSEDGLLDGFYSAASDELRAHATSFLGTSVSDMDDGPPPEVLDRLRALMERRLNVAREVGNPKAFVKELAGFGWWFASAKFDERWSLDTLRAVLRITGTIEQERDVAKLLTIRCGRYPVESVDCLRLMVEGDRDQWLMVRIGRDVHKILTCAIASDNSDAVELARRLKEDLIARGYPGFRDVLASGGAE